MLRILSVSTLFPSPARPAFGTFVGSQMRAIAARGDVDLVMLNPVGVPPWPLSSREPYRSLAACPERSTLGALLVRHPRFMLWPKIGGTSNPARIARAILPLARRLHEENPFDLVDAQFFFPDGPAAASVARELGLPLAIKARGSDILYWSTLPQALAQMQAAARQAAGLLTVSLALGRDMAALGFPEERIIPHYTGLDRERFHPRPREEARSVLAQRLGLTLPPGATLLVSAGALIPRKGQGLAMEALGELPGAHLALAGTGPDEPILRAAAHQHGLSERVHFLGQVNHDDLPLLMSAADALVLPSAQEGLANVWVEALGCGTPLVIPPVGGAPEVVTSPTAGRIAAREGPAIAAALRDLLASPPVPEEVATHAARFSWERNAECLVEIWTRLAGLSKSKA